MMSQSFSYGLLSWHPNRRSLKSCILLKVLYNKSQTELTFQKTFRKADRFHTGAELENNE